MRKQFLSRFGQLHAIVSAIKQAGFETPLQCSDVVADVRLSHAQLLGRLCRAEQCGCRTETLEVLKFQNISPRKSAGVIPSNRSVAIFVPVECKVRAGTSGNDAKPQRF